MKSLLLPAAALALSACQMTTPEIAADALAEITPETSNPTLLVGRTILHEDGNLAVHPDGTIGGDLTGSWEIKTSQWCRTIATPVKYAGTECRYVSVSGNTAIFTRENGVTYKMKLK